MFYHIIYIGCTPFHVSYLFVYVDSKVEAADHDELRSFLSPRIRDNLTFTCSIDKHCVCTDS